MRAVQPQHIHVHDRPAAGHVHNRTDRRRAAAGDGLGNVAAGVGRAGRRSWRGCRRWHRGVGRRRTGRRRWANAAAGPGECPHPGRPARRGLDPRVFAQVPVGHPVGVQGQPGVVPPAPRAAVVGGVVPLARLQQCLALQLPGRVARFPPRYVDAGEGAAAHHAVAHQHVPTGVHSQVGEAAVGAVAGKRPLLHQAGRPAAHVDLVPAHAVHRAAAGVAAHRVCRPQLASPVFHVQQAVVVALHQPGGAGLRLAHRQAVAVHRHRARLGHGGRPPRVGKLPHRQPVLVVAVLRIHEVVWLAGVGRPTAGQVTLQLGRLQGEVGRADVQLDVVGRPAGVHHVFLEGHHVVAHE